MTTAEPSHSGGCQCGAIRFRLSGQPGKASICHCRMCQKAFGSFYGPFLNVGRATLTWTRGEPARFRSSSAVTRGFCAACGTPLTYEAPDGVALAIGAFDEPGAFRPVVQFGLEGKLAWVDELGATPATRTDAHVEDAPFLARLVSFQHPDHDTPDDWMPPGPTSPP